MQQSDFFKPAARSSMGSPPVVSSAIRSWFSSRRGLIVAGVAIVVAGVALGWNWLSAIGVAPIILSLAPCAAMCALGACAMMRGGSSCAKSGSPEPVKSAEPATAPPRSSEQNS